MNVTLASAADLSITHTAATRNEPRGYRRRHSPVISASSRYRSLHIPEGE